MKTRLTFAVCILSVLLSGCVQMTMGPHQAQLQNIELLRKSEIVSMNVGPFALEKGKEADLNKNVSIRGSTLSPANDATFSDYLRDGIVAELQAAGKYDPASALVIRGWLTDSQVSAPADVGRGSLGARFNLTRAGTTVYERTLQVEAQWPSSFVGASAIPTAANEYTSLFKKLISRLFEDKDFLAEARKK